MQRPQDENPPSPLAHPRQTREIVPYINYCTGRRFSIGLAVKGLTRIGNGPAIKWIHRGTEQVERQTGDGMGNSDQIAGKPAGAAGGRPWGAAIR